MDNHKNVKKKIISLLIMASMILVIPISASSAKTQKMEITMLNVGAGDCFYIEMPNGDDVLIDGGLSKYGDKIVKELNKKEKNMTLETVISTHPDADHCGGLQTVFKKMKVKKFYYPKDTKYDTKTAKSVISLAKKESSCKVYNAKPGTVIKGGNGSYLKFIQSTKDYKTDNEDSVMTYIKYGKLDVLLTGDAEDGSEYKGLKTINMDIVEAPHHGSKYSSSSSFIKKFDPESVLISTDGHKYGHPNSETLARYKAYDKNIKVYRTDKKGNVTITSNGKTWSFSCKGSTISTSTPTTNTSSGGSGYVYITKTGSKYHRVKTCSGLRNANTIYKVTEKEAKSKGLTKCKICY